MYIEVKQSTIHGNGVFATQDLDEGEFQFVYGYVVPIIPGTITDRYGVEWDDDTSYVPYAPWCFTNHSNKPNCEIACDENDVLFITTLRDIAEGEELTIDYGFDPGADG